MQPKDVESIRQFLKRTECHFNWNIAALKKPDQVESFQRKLEEHEHNVNDPVHKNCIMKLNYAFAVLFIDKEESLKFVNEVIDDIRGAQDGQLCKYRIVYEHIVYAFKAFVLIESQDDCTLEVTKLVEQIKPKSEMSRIENSAMLGIHAQVLLPYGPDGVAKSIPLLREAIRLNPQESEFKLCLVIGMHRKRHYDRNLKTEITWKNIEEPVNILKQLLQLPGISSLDKEIYEYYLATAYDDLLRGSKNNSPEKVRTYKNQILKSCEYIHDKSTSPSRLAYCADKFFHLGKNRRKGLQIIESALKNFPNNVCVNSAACRLFQNTGDLNAAVRCAQVASDNGGFGAAMILFDLKTIHDKNFDVEEYFRNLLQRSHPSYAIQIHLKACLHYLLTKGDVVKGAHHLEMILIEDPYYSALRNPHFYHPLKKTVLPLQLAYTEIINSEESSLSEEDITTLRRVKAKIEEVFENDDDCYGTKRNSAAFSKKVQSKP